MQDFNFYGPRAHPLKEVARKRGVTLIQLANYLGVSVSSIHAWLSGYRKPPEHVQIQLEELQINLQSMEIDHE